MVTRWKKGEARQRHEGADHDVVTLRPDQHGDGRRHQVALFHQFGEMLGRHEPQPRKERHDIDREGDEERVSATPTTENPPVTG